MPARRVLALLIATLCVIPFIPAGTAGATRSTEFASQRLDGGRGRGWTSLRIRAAEPLPMTKVPPPSARSLPQRGVPTTFAAASPSGSDGARPYGGGSGPLPFEQEEIVDPSLEPYAAHGLIVGSSAMGDFTCSGTAVVSDNKSLVWTAGHCLHLFGEFMTDIAFLPGHESENIAPYGQWEAEVLRVPRRWQRRQDPRYDFGAFTVNPNAEGLLLGDVITPRGIAFNQQPTETFSSFGYPGRPRRYDGGHLQSCTSNGNARIWGGMVAMGCDMQEGSSGGGWVIRDQFVSSNVSGGNPAVWPEVSFGPYLGQAALNLYDSIRGGTAPMPSPTPTSPTLPPDTHPMRISLNLDHHLVISGRLRARDGFAACVNDAPIVIGRKRSGSFYPVGDLLFTNESGRFRARVRDRKGIYVALAPGSPYDLTQDCAEAMSGFKRHRH